jgi:signal transduction histidine kinase
LERDLHDGVQQHLVALAVNLQLTRQLVGSDPDAANTLLEEMSRDVRDALDDVRRLAWRIYPSLLRDRGLREALRVAASEATIRVRVEVPADRRYPAAIEEAVYFCCVETLAEATGLANSANVRVSGDENALRFDVTLDGVALDGRPALEGAADRLSAVGGRLTVSADAERLCIVGTVPLRA